MGLALLATLCAAPASAQGLFDSLFNGDRYAPRQQTYAPRGGSAYAPPQPSSGSWGQPQYGAQDGSPAAQSSGGTGRSVAYCVRLCDGRFFPMQRQANA